MSIYSATVSISGQTPTLLFPPRDCESTVYILPGTEIRIGDANVDNASWTVPVNVEKVLVLPANEELYVWSPSGPGPFSVRVLVITKVA